MGDKRRLDPDWNLREAVEKWLRGWLSGKPHFVIGQPKTPYMLRWYVLPRNPWINIYLHKFLRDDEDRALHDHPWWFVSWMLRGGYEEFIYQGFLPLRRRWLSLVFRPATHRHRVRLLRDPVDAVIPAWTLVITGPRAREWGFWCPKGFVPWHIFTKPQNYGEVGRGCD